jgi:NOL1/NOP2/fmu family ribosome biogenesis protein
MKHTSANFILIGSALFGPRWQSEMARVIGVNDRSIRRWAAGRDIPVGLWGHLANLCYERGNQLLGLAERLGHTKGDSK